LESGLEFDRLKKKFTADLNNVFDRRIHPVQAIMSIAGLLALGLGVIARFVTDERIHTVVLVLLVTVSVFALICITAIILTYLFQRLSAATRRGLGRLGDVRRREADHNDQDPPGGIGHLSLPLAKNPECPSRRQSETRGHRF
jgi:hypothetical protein